MRNSKKTRVRNAVVAIFLAILYGFFIFDTAYFYTLEPSEREISPYLSYAVPCAIFILICSYFSRVLVWLVGIMAVVVLAFTSASIHFYFSEMYGVADFSGIRGAWHLALLTGILFLYMFLVIALLAVAVKYALRKISLHRGTHGCE